MDRSEYISASEVGDFVYCKRGWWLRSRGLLETTFEMQKGTQAHESLFTSLIRIKLIQQILLWSGIVLLVLLIILLLII